MLTPEQIAKIRQKDASLTEAHRRDSLTNYYEGYFFVTLNTRCEAPILSFVAGHVGASGPDAPHCEYTELGRGVIAGWNRMPSVCPYARVIACEAMPDHFHGLLQLLPGNKRHLGSLMSGFMSGCTHAYWDVLGINWRHDQFGAYAQKMPDRDRDHTRSFRGPALFVRGYNDVVPITAEEVQIKIDYIRKQAEKRLIQGECHNCFAIHRDQHSQNWKWERVLNALLSDRQLANSETRREEAVRNVLSRLATDNDGTIQTVAVTDKRTLLGPAMGRAEVAREAVAVDGLSLSYLGNRTILASGKKLPLVCHRADASRFEEQKCAVLDKARDGWVVVSAFISPKEREIRNQLMTEQLPFVEIMDNGFSERYKPMGKAFYACAEQRLVQISCWGYMYQRDEKISREFCLVMNELARLVSGGPDDWWKKKE